jgi:hypothetical protein
MLEKTEGQSRMDNPKKLATLTQDEDNPEKLATLTQDEDKTKHTAQKTQKMRMHPCVTAKY